MERTKKKLVSSTSLEMQRRIEAAYLGRFSCTLRSKVIDRERSSGVDYLKIREKLGIGKVGNVMETHESSCLHPSFHFYFLLAIVIKETCQNPKLAVIKAQLFFLPKLSPYFY